jgi:CRP-like cAMP-binding protein/Zn-dependent protease
LATAHAAGGGVGTGSARVSVWDRFAESVSLGSYVPVLRQDLTWARMTTRHGRPNIMLADRPRKYLRVSERDDFLVQRMDGTRRVSDLVVDYFEKFGTFGLKQVSDLVTILRQAGFLADPPRDVWAALRQQLDPTAAPVERRWTEGTAMRLKVPLRGIDGFVSSYYLKVGKYVFSPPFLVASVIVSVLGLAAFVGELLRGRDPFAPIAGSGLAGIVALVVAYYLVIFIHESAHALTCKHYGRLVPKGGFLLYYLFPAFYVDVTDAWLEPWRRRIAIFWAGPYSGFCLAGFSSLLVWALPQGVIATVFFKLAVAAYLTNLFNLMPLLLLDGYWILEQWLEIPQLRERALAFVGGPFWRLLWTRRRLTRRELFFAIFGILSAVYTFLAGFFAIFLWRKRLTPVVAPIWSTPGLLSKVVSVVVIGVIAIPLGIRHGRRFWRMRTVVTKAPELARRAIFTVRMNDRLILLGGLGFLRGMPSASIERLARAARIRHAATGKVVVRQGERGAEFFIIADGQAEVSILERAEERAVRKLKPGDFFGERALLEGGIRTATIRALSPMRLLVFDERAFWGELAGPIAWQRQVRESLNERELLRRVPLFADVSSRQLDLLAVKLSVMPFRKGAVIVRRGDPGHDFFIVRDGTVAAIDDARKTLREMGPGAFFGEIALLRDTPRTATVVGRAAGSLWRLGRQDFHELLGQYLALEDEFEGVAVDRGHGMEGAA